MKLNWQRWKFSLLAAGICVAMGTYTLVDSYRKPKKTPIEKQVNTPDLMSVYQLDTLEKFQFKNKERTCIARIIENKWQLFNLDQSKIFLSDFEQALLQRTAEQLKTLNVQRLLQYQPTVQQQKEMGLGENSLQVKLMGTQNKAPVIKSIQLGNLTPTGSGFYIYTPKNQQVYLGYINIPEALTRLLKHA